MKGLASISKIRYPLNECVEGEVLAFRKGCFSDLALPYLVRGNPAALSVWMTFGDYLTSPLLSLSALVPGSVPA